MRAEAVRQLLATVGSAVGGVIVVTVLATLPAHAGGGAPGPSTPTKGSIPGPDLKVRPAAWDRMGSVLRAAAVREHPDAVVEQPVAAPDDFVGGVRLTVQFHDRAGSGSVTVDVPPVGRPNVPCTLPAGTLVDCSQTMRPDGSWEQVVTYALGGHSPESWQGAEVTVARPDGVVVRVSSDSVSTTALRALARQAIALVPPLSDPRQVWTRAGS